MNPIINIGRVHRPTSSIYDKANIMLSETKILECVDNTSIDSGIIMCLQGGDWTRGWAQSKKRLIVLHAQSHKNRSDVSSLSEQISIFIGLKFDHEKIRCCS